MVASGAERGGDGDLGADEAKAIASTHESGPGDGAVPDADFDVLAVGTKVGRYLVVDRIGAGAMGVVYAAYDPKLDRKIALKLLRPQEGKGDQARRTARLEREAQAIAKLSHPNVVGIFDVGVHEGQVFMAMEYLAGGTLREWLAARKRTWREIVKMFIEVGHGLAGAHAEGLIHRDFKPDNVLLDKNGVPKVVDFGLVRLTAATVEMTSTGSVDGEVTSAGQAAPEKLGTKVAGQGESLTRTGALTGTPAYMAPEQFLGKAIDARTDQFAFCVALYEALHGERPFAGETVMALAESVTGGRMRAAPKGSDVPGWVRACVIQGLRVDPTDRYPGFDRLLGILANDPIARRRRRVLGVTASMLIVVGVLSTRHLLIAKRQEIDREVTDFVVSASSALREASTKKAEAVSLREKAFAAFDNYAQTKGEQSWQDSLRFSSEAAAAYQRGIQSLEAAATLVPTRDLRNQAANAIADYLGLRELPPNEREASIRDLAAYDEGGSRLRQLNAPAHLSLDTLPPKLAARLETYDSRTYQTIDSPRALGPAPFVLDLTPGSYRLTFEATDKYVGFSYPIVLAAGEKFKTTVRVPPRSTVPDGFVYIPNGRFLFGSADEDIRAVFLETTPLHSASTPAFLMSRYETTIGEWIEFLNDIPPVQRDLRRPQGRKDGVGGFIDLQRTLGGEWELQFRATNVTYRAKLGEPFRYKDRYERAAQDWLRFPVTGISPDDALEYASWLDRSGRIPGARLCTEREWERAARGADGREFPHGNRLLPEDANFDLTYGRKDGAYGPDEVGSHPTSRSPFDIDDLAGNVWDITSSVLDKGQFVGRGSSFYQRRVSVLSANRDPISAVTRDYTVGLRICADVHFEAGRG